jgi:hypothetical protein
MLYSFLIPALFFFTPNDIHFTKVESIDIHTAVKDKLVEVEVNSKGGHSGDCIALSIIPVSDKRFEFTIPAGTHFIAKNNPEQDIFVVEDQILAFDGKKEQSYSVEGFCSQADDHSPEEGSGFKMTLSKNKELIKLASFIKGKGYSNQTKQSAVWAVSDGESIATIFDDEQENVGDLRSYVCELTERPNPWYNSTVKYTIREDRQIETSPTLIEGTIEYKVVEKGKMKLSIYRVDGSFVKDIFKDIAMNHICETSINFKGKVQGWEPGGYEVRILINDKVIQAMPFEV